MANAGPLHAWIVSLPERGRYCFSREEAEAVHGASPAAVKMTVYRLKRTGVLASPRRGFFVVVPPEYRAAGCPPASWFVDDLLRHLGRRYYVGLLTAAALHGAGHQQPMAFQVIADSMERNITVGRVRIEFHESALVADAATQAVRTETGSMRVATPEMTAFDLVRFPKAAGYWSNIATVLGELADQVEPHRLAALVPRVRRSDAQRLGWLFERLERPALADALEGALEGARLLSTPLSTTRAVSGSPLDRRWRVWVNDDVEADL